MLHLKSERYLDRDRGRERNSQRIILIHIWKKNLFLLKFISDREVFNVFKYFKTTLSGAMQNVCFSLQQTRKIHYFVNKVKR